MKITSTEVGSEDLQISERDLVEIDSFSRQLYDMVMTPFSEETLVDLKSKNVDKLLNKVRDTLHVENVPATVKAMRVLSAQDRVDDALFLWGVLQQNPKHCTLFAWTAYLTVLSTHGRAMEARDAIKEMVLSGVQPDSYVYGTVVNGLVRERRLEDAYAVSRSMLQSGLRPNNVVVSSLLYGCIATRQLHRADETFDLLRNYIEEPDTITLSLMIKVSELEPPHGAGDGALRLAGGSPAVAHTRHLPRGHARLRPIPALRHTRLPLLPADGGRGDPAPLCRATTFSSTPARDTETSHVPMKRSGSYRPRVASQPAHIFPPSPRTRRCRRNGRFLPRTPRGEPEIHPRRVETVEPGGSRGEGKDTIGVCAGVTAETRGGRTA